MDGIVASRKLDIKKKKDSKETLDHLEYVLNEVPTFQEFHDSHHQGSRTK